MTLVEAETDDKSAARIGVQKFLSHAKLAAPFKDPLKEWPTHA